jgi:DNA helicase HerA-like ATPase
MNTETDYRTGDVGEEVAEFVPRSSDVSEQLADDVARSGGPWAEPEEYQGCIGRTMYDMPSSSDGTVTLLTPASNISRVPAQALLRIKSRPAKAGGDGRQYLGVVVQGPFAEPDGLRADAPLVVTTAIKGTTFSPRYHGRIQIRLLGEELDNVIVVPRFRPLPNSPVFRVDEEETARILGSSGDLLLGRGIGFDNLEIRMPSRNKALLPRHFGALGTTGGGKSTTVSNQILQFSKAGVATVLIDTEGEYTNIDQPTEDKTMIALLEKASLKPEGVSDLRVYRLIGRDSTAKIRATDFALAFSALSPYAAAEILELSEAQLTRFFSAYDVAKLVLKDAGIYPTSPQQEKQVLELDEFEEGYPNLTLSRLIDIASFFKASISGEEVTPANPEFSEDRVRAKIKERIAKLGSKQTSEVSWGALISKLRKLKRMDIFDNAQALPINFNELVNPGRVSVIDLSDTDSTIVNNLVIASILRGVQIRQEELYSAAVKSNRNPDPVMVVIEEAHEFLSRDRIAKMDNLFQQVARIARRGRKRWLGLMFVTQLPQHLPDEVLGLINNFILHKISDDNVITRLKKSIGGIDDGLWTRLPNLAPGQAVVSITTLSRPVLTAIDPTPCKLLMTR